MAALRLADEGSFLPLEPADGGIGIEAEDQQIPEAPGLLQILDMADMEEIETAIGKDDAAPGTAFLLQDKGESRAAFDLEIAIGVLASGTFDQFIGGDRRSPHLADDDPGGDIGDTGRHRKLQPRRQTDADQRQDRIAGPGNVEDLARLGRQMHRAALVIKETHPLFTAGNEKRLQIEANAQLFSGRREGRLVTDGNPGSDLGFLAIGGEESGTPIFAVIVPLRIDDDSDPPGFGAADNGGKDGRGQHPLEIIGDEDDVAAPHGRLDALQQFSFGRRADGVAAFPIDAQHLLITGDDPGLAAGHPPRLQNYTVNADPLPLQGCAQQLTITVVAEDTGDLDAAPEGDKIVDDIPRPSQTQVVFLDIDHLHRRFGGDPLGLAEEVFIEHEIADDQSANAAAVGQNPFEKLAIDGGQLSRRHHPSPPPSAARRSRTARAKSGMLISWWPVMV